MNLGRNKAFASQLVTELSQQRASSRLSLRQGHMLGHLVPPPVSALLRAQDGGRPNVLPVSSVVEGARTRGGHGTGGPGHALGRLPLGHGTRPVSRQGPQFHLQHNPGIAEETAGQYRGAGWVDRKSCHCEGARVGASLSTEKPGLEAYSPGRGPLHLWELQVGQPLSGATSHQEGDRAGCCSSQAWERHSLPRGPLNWGKGGKELLVQKP